MKALNRAIARTVSQLGRYGREGCHPPMLFALEQHLDALLTMERKQLQVAGMKFATLTGDGTGEALPVINITNTGCADGKAVEAHVLRELERTKAPEGMVAFSTPQEKNGTLLAGFMDEAPLSVPPVRWYQTGVHGIGDLGLQWTPSAASEQPVPPAPDVIDMTDPRNWQVGDIVMRTCASTASFLQYENCTVTENDENTVRIANSQDGRSVTYPHGTQYDGAEHYFKWLRHGEAQQ